MLNFQCHSKSLINTALLDRHWNNLCAFSVDYLRPWYKILPIWTIVYAKFLMYLSVVFSHWKFSVAIAPHCHFQIKCLFITISNPPDDFSFILYNFKRSRSLSAAVFPGSQNDSGGRRSDPKTVSYRYRPFRGFPLNLWKQRSVRLFSPESLFLRNVRITQQFYAYSKLCGNGRQILSRLSNPCWHFLPRFLAEFR